MRLNWLPAVLLAFGFTCLFAEEARAQRTYAYSEVIYDSGTAKINGYSYTEADYDTESFYVSYVDGKLTASDGTVKDPSSVSLGGRAEVRTTMNAWADTQYTISALHGVTAIYYVVEGVQPTYV